MTLKPSLFFDACFDIEVESVHNAVRVIIESQIVIIEDQTPIVAENDVNRRFAEVAYPMIPVEIIHKSMVKESASNTPKAEASKRMLPKQVTRNVTNAEVGGIVFRSEIFPQTQTWPLE